MMVTVQFAERLVSESEFPVIVNEGWVGLKSNAESRTQNGEFRMERSCACDLRFFAAAIRRAVAAFSLDGRRRVRGDATRRPRTHSSAPF
jgi:hypothetical protein